MAIKKAIWIVLWFLWLLCILWLKFPITFSHFQFCEGYSRARLCSLLVVKQHLFYPDDVSRKLGFQQMKCLEQRWSISTMEEHLIPKTLGRKMYYQSGMIIKEWKNNQLCFKKQSWHPLGHQHQTSTSCCGQIETTRIL